MGYPRIRINPALCAHDGGGEPAYQSYSLSRNGKIAYEQTPAESKANFDFSPASLHRQCPPGPNDSLINTPMDFTRHNNVPWKDEPKPVQSVLFPASVPGQNVFT